jgi:hypothetical protein
MNELPQTKLDSDKFKSQVAIVKGARLHYVIGGSGESIQKLSDINRSVLVIY